MVFKRVWDESCPHVWDSWDGADGVKWVIRDLRPEDDEKAIKIIVENFFPDETLCRVSGDISWKNGSEVIRRQQKFLFLHPGEHSGMNTIFDLFVKYVEESKPIDLVNDSENLEGAKDIWRNSLSERMSLGCYEEKNNQSKLVALNVCIICFRGDKHNIKAEGAAAKNLDGALNICEKKVDIFKVLDLDTYLRTIGLVVHRDYRASRLGSRMLAAGELLCLHHSVYGTSGEFTSTTSQKIAERLGYTTAATVTFKELAEAGLNFIDDETKCVKIMIKKFVNENNV